MEVIFRESAHVGYGRRILTSRRPAKSMIKPGCGLYVDSGVQDSPRCSISAGAAMLVKLHVGTAGFEPATSAL